MQRAGQQVGQASGRAEPSQRRAGRIARWQAVLRGTGLLDEDGRARPTIFTEMSRLAARTHAVNLGQGFPDEDGPDSIKDAAIAAIRAGRNQYPPLAGIPELRRAIAEHQRRCYGIELDPDTQVLVTTGATEAMAATILAYSGPGDDVVTIEPTYDAYAGAIAMAGARHVPVPLLLDADSFRLDLDALGRAVTDRTVLIVVNSPHNPTGTVLTPQELGAIVAVAAAHGALIVTDEVYEHLTYGGVRHVPIATLPGAGERTISISSAGKSFSLTGWKVGWATGPARLLTPVATIKQFLTFVSGAPFQPAIAGALGDPSTYRGIQRELAAHRDLLVDGLRRAGFHPYAPQGAYFVCADALGLGRSDGAQLCRDLVRDAGVVAIPVDALVTSATGRERFRPLVRFTFVKSRVTLEDAIARLLAWGARA